MCVFNFQWNFGVLFTHIMEGKWAVVISLSYYFVYGFISCDKKMTSSYQTFKSGVSKLFAREGHMRWDEHLQGPGSQKKCTHSSFRIRPAARSTREKKELSCDQRHCTHIYNYIYIMSMVATQLLLFPSCGACRGPDSKKKSEYIFLRHRPAGFAS